MCLYAASVYTVVVFSFSTVLMPYWCDAVILILTTTKCTSFEPDYLIIDFGQPALLVCRTGRYVTGVVVGCLRKLQRWSLASIFEEYRRFAVAGSGQGQYTYMQQQHEQFIELFDCDLVAPSGDTSDDSIPPFLRRRSLGSSGSPRDRLITANGANAAAVSASSATVSAAGGNNQGGNGNGTSTSGSNMGDSTMAAIAELAMAAGVAPGTMNGNGSDSTKSDPTLSRSPSLLNFVNAPSPSATSTTESRSASMVSPRSLEERSKNNKNNQPTLTVDSNAQQAVDGSGENSNNTAESGHSSATTSGTIESATAERAAPGEQNSSSSSSTGILGSWGWPMSSS